MKHREVKYKQTTNNAIVNQNIKKSAKSPQTQLNLTICSVDLTQYIILHHIMKSREAEYKQTTNNATVYKKSRKKVQNHPKHKHISHPNRVGIVTGIVRHQNLSTIHTKHGYDITNEMVWK